MYPPLTPVRLQVDRTEMSTLCFEHGMHRCDHALHTSPMGLTLLQKEIYGCARDMTAMGTTRLLKRAPHAAGALEARTVTRAVRGIRALTSLPPILLSSTLVHELLHYHMFVVGKFRTNPPAVEEGMCELAALLYLRSLPQSAERDMRIRQRLENPSRVYGDGLRAAEQVCDWRGAMVGNAGWGGRRQVRRGNRGRGWEACCGVLCGNCAIMVSDGSLAPYRLPP
jgi:hypothetical protein